MAIEPSSERGRMLAEGLNHLRRAIELLDAAGAPAHIGAHLDLAAHQLSAVIEPDMDRDRRVLD